MTHLEIYQMVEPRIPRGLLLKYGHLCYGEMSEVPELAQWSGLLRRAQEEWTRVDATEGIFS